MESKQASKYRGWSIVSVLFAAFFFVVMMSNIVAGDLSAAVVSGAFMISSSALCESVSRLSASTRITVYRAIVTVAVFEGVLSIGQVFFSAPLTWGYLGSAVKNPLEMTNNLGLVEVGRAVGTLAHPILLGFLCAMGIVALWGGAAERLWVKLILSAPMLLGILASGTRSALLAVLIGIAVLALGGGGRNRRRFAIVFVALAYSVLAIPRVVERFSFLKSLEGTFSLEHRMRSITSVAPLLDRDSRSVLLGEGSNGIQGLYERGVLHNDKFFAIDNQFVYSLATGGVLALLLLILLVVSSFILGGRLNWAAATVMVTFFFSFDSLSWNIPVIVCAVLLSPVGTQIERDEELAEIK
ncbi:O-antigen ligase family protein [Gordonia amicalis]